MTQTAPSATKPQRTEPSADSSTVETPQRYNVFHAITVASNPTGDANSASCSCGWEGKNRRTRSAALHTFEIHVDRANDARWKHYGVPKTMDYEVRTHMGTYESDEPEQDEPDLSIVGLLSPRNIVNALVGGLR